MTNIKAGESVPGWIAWFILMFVVCSIQTSTNKIEKKVDNLIEIVTETREFIGPPLDTLSLKW